MRLRRRRRERRPGEYPPSFTEAWIRQTRPRGQERLAPPVSVPARVSREWLDRTLPAMGREEIQLVVTELERRGWPPADVAVSVLPHLLPKLPAEDANAVLAALGELGLSEKSIARLC